MLKFRFDFQSLGWREFVLLLTVAVICGSLLIFVGVTNMVSGGELHDSEIRWMRSLRYPDDPLRPVGPRWLVEMSRDITALGSSTVLALLTLFVVGYLLIARWHGSAMLVLAAVGGGMLLSQGLKGFFDRDRPDAIPHLTDALFKSYPSGHSMMSSVVYLTLAVLVSGTLQRRRMKIYWVSVALFLSFIVGLSRIYLGVHYPTDVVAGWTAGTAWALLCWLIAYCLERRARARKTIA
ncbi:MAG TPA: phosphatase PAP2 family protein [Terrimicrobiaceae bacterium]